MPYASNAGIRLYYEVHGGGGETVLLVPGLGLRALGWAKVAELLAKDYRVLVMEPRGTGESDTPDHPYTGDTVSSDVLAVLDDAGAQAVHIVGFSMGGMIAQEFALRHPDRVSSLVLLATYAAPDAWFKRLFEFRRDLVLGMGLQEHFRVFMLFIFSPFAFRREPEAVARLDQAMRDNPPDEKAYLRQIDFCLAHDTASRIAELRPPALVITGGHDILTPPPLGQELAAAIPGARFESIELASHGLLLEYPVELVEMCTDHFAAHAAAV